MKSKRVQCPGSKKKKSVSRRKKWFYLLNTKFSSFNKHPIGFRWGGANGSQMGVGKRMND